MKNVVVPIDFSETSAIATKFGANLAKLMNYDLRILHVSDVVLSGAHSLTTPEQRGKEKKLRKELAAFIRANVDPVLKAESLDTTFVPEVKLSILSGLAANKILSLSKETTTAFIVMGGVGAGASTLSPGLYGSVATPVALRGACPVVLIPKGYLVTTLERFAIAFDDADEIVRIRHFSRSIIEKLKPEVRYVHVRKANWREEMKNEGDFAGLFGGEGTGSHIDQFDVLPEGNVADQLSNYASAKQINLLILGGKRQGFWRRLFDKNHLKPIIQVCGVPLLVIPFSATEN